MWEWREDFLDVSFCIYLKAAKTANACLSAGARDVFSVSRSFFSGNWSWGVRIECVGGRRRAGGCVTLSECLGGWMGRVEKVK
jgi:hypothetical protein